MRAGSAVFVAAVAARVLLSGTSEGVVPDATLPGTWGHAIEVPGTAAFNTGFFNSALNSISCASVGNCSAGVLRQRLCAQQAFVVNETAGVWRTALEVPGTAVLNTAGIASVSSVSCASAGNCSAGGSYGSHVRGDLRLPRLRRQRDRGRLAHRHRGSGHSSAQHG